MSENTSRESAHGGTAGQPGVNAAAGAAAVNAHDTVRIEQVPPVPQPEASTAPTQTFGAVGAVGAAAPADRPARKKSMALPIIGTAALSAILASVATVGVSMALTDDDPVSAPTSQSATADNADKGTTGTVSPIENSTNQNPDWETVTNAVAKTVVAIEVSSQEGDSQGSGVIIDTEGHIVTNNHVVEGATNNEVTVTLDDGRMYTAEITGLDAATDLAVIKIKNPPSDLSSAGLADSDTVTVGAAVLAMGNPLGLSQTATTGIVSALDRPVSTAQTSDGTLVVTNAIQIDAAINPGNSGGPLFNSKGEVIGITSSIATMSSSSSSQSGSIGLGFAIPSNLAHNISQQLIENGKAEHAFLGVTMTDGSGSTDQETRQGAVVQDVTADSAAAKAGLQSGDVIIAVDGSTVTGSESLTGFVREHKAGDTITLGVIRDGKSMELTATLSTRTETATALPEEEDGQSNGLPGSGSQGGTEDDQDGNSQDGQGSQGGGSQDGQGSQGESDGSQDFNGRFDPANPPSLEDLQELFDYYQNNR